MTNWEYLMGTPALAAQTISKIVRVCWEAEVYTCDGCPLSGAPCNDYRELKDWLESEMD